MDMHKNFDSLGEVAFFSGYLLPGSGLFGWPHDSASFAMVMEHLRRASEGDDIEDAKLRIQTLFEPYLRRAAQIPEAVQGVPNLLNESIAEEYVQSVIDFTNGILVICNKLERQGIDVSAYRQKTLDLGLTVLPPLILNPHVSPMERLNSALWLGGNTGYLDGLAGSMGHKSRVFISPLGPNNVLSFAGQRIGQDPVFLIGPHRGTAESFLPLLPKNIPNAKRLIDGTAYDPNFIATVQKAARNPAPMPPLRDLLEERRAALMAQQNTAIIQNLVL